MLDAHVEDGERDDLVAHDVRTWAFGNAEGSMAIAPVPLPGRDLGARWPLRETAITAVARVG